MIKIGVSACFMYQDMERKVFGPKTLSYIENDMANYLAIKGVMPVLIPNLSEELLDDLIDEMDGFVFQGGTDLAPQSYGEEPINNGEWSGDPVRDKYELLLMKKVVERNKPIFGICRGMQLINVFFGGTLYQDTITQRSNSINHRDAIEYDKRHHAINFHTDGFLSKVYKNKPQYKVNSIHHQSVKDLGDNIKILASSVEDGVIEAIEYSKTVKGKIFGVQWHPEFSNTLKDIVVDSSILYDYFINHVKSQTVK